jgi:uncharacterized membrane protein YqaE (UPF0057 family)
MCSSDIFLGILAILFPPLPVWVKCGICSADSVINILLCVLGGLPGLIHAWYIIAKYPDPYDQQYETLPQDGEGQHHHHIYYVVQGQPKRQGNVNYGTQGGSSQGQHAAQEQGIAGSSDGQVPPSYADVVAGDNKVQSHD